MNTAETQSPEGFLLFRVAVASGLFASVGTTLAWIVWFAVQVRDPEILITVAVGAVIGFLVHWFQHYIHLALHERHSGSEGDAAGETAALGRARAMASLAWATGFGVLTLACEHLVAHVAALYLQPVLASLATMLPAGVILGLSFQFGRKDRSFGGSVFDGVALGLMISLLTGLIWWAGWGSAPILPLASWWCIIGVFVRLNTPVSAEEFRWWRPMAAVISAFVFVFAMTLVPTGITLPDWTSPVKGWVMAVSEASVQVIDSPGLPASFWIHASKTFEAEHSKDVPKEALTEPAIAPTTSLAERMAAVAQPQATPANPYRTLFLQQISQGLRSDMVRSWVILLVFGLCLGIAPSQERRLRPANYPSSETRAKDVSIAAALVLAVVIACVMGHISGSSVESVSPNSPDQRESS